jgi:hypothetical protein
MRPQYETESDRQVETEVAAMLHDQYQLVCHKLPISYRVDWIVYAPGSVTNPNRLHGFIELKGRKIPRNQYPTLILSLAKYAAGCDLARITNTPFWVGARWTDGVGFCRADGFVPEVQMGGRTDRGDSADIEPVVHLPIEGFKDSPVP